MFERLAPHHENLMPVVPTQGVCIDLFSCSNEKRFIEISTDRHHEL